MYGKSYKNVFGLGDIVGGGKATAQKTMQQAGIVGYNVLSGIEVSLRIEMVDRGLCVAFELEREKKKNNGEQKKM